MNKEKLQLIKELYSDVSSKYVITDEKLNILFSSVPALFKELDEDMFSQSNLVRFNDGIFPATKKTVATLFVDDVPYIAVIRPLHEEDARYYLIEILDSYDFSELELHSHCGLAEMNTVSALRSSASSVYAARMLMNEKLISREPDLASAADILDKSCSSIMAATVNKRELQLYIQGMFNVKDINLSKFLKDLIDLCCLRLAHCGMCLADERIEPDVTVSMDPDRFVPVFLNLICNSFMYNTSDCKRLIVSLEKADNEARLCFTDNGTGMSLDQIEKAFIPFALCTDMYSRSCLGLPLTNLFAKAFGGSASIISKENETKICIRLPIKHKPSTAAVSAASYAFDRFSPVNVYLSQIEKDTCTYL